MANLNLIIQGTDAEKAAKRLSDLFAEASESTTISQIQSSGLPEATRKVIDPIALTGVILAIPEAILAVMDLVDRIRKRKRAQALIDAAQRVSNETKVQVNFVLPQGTIRRLDQMTADELLDIAVKQTAVG